jgi:LytR cell envelope-related transcriptional attenuator
VDSSYAPTFDAGRWRTAAILVSAIAALELAVLVAIGVAALGRTVAHRVQAAALQKAAGVPSVPKPGPPGKPRLTRGATDVLVLNGSGMTGAAGIAADRLRARGYQITSVGNAPKQSSATRTLVMFRPGYRAEAARLARDAHTTVVAPLDGVRPAALMGAQVVLVVGH